MFEPDAQPDADLFLPTSPDDSFDPVAIEVVEESSIGGSPFAECLTPPRLGIIHLLAWTGVTAVLLSWNRVIKMLQSETAELSQDVMQMVWECLGTMIIGALVVGTVVLLNARRRSSARLQPGHWIVLISVSAALLSRILWTTLAMNRWLAGETGWEHERFLLVYFLPIGLIQLGTAAAYISLGTFARDARRGRTLFWSLGVISLVRGICMSGEVLIIGIEEIANLPIWSVILLAVALIVALRDLVARSTRDWVHWLGICYLAIVSLARIAWWVWVKFFFVPSVN